MSPPSARSKPRISRRIVDFPDPLEPSRIRVAPGSIVSDTRSTTTRPLNDLVTSRKAIMRAASPRTAAPGPYDTRRIRHYAVELARRRYNVGVDRRGFGFVEILIALVVVAVAGVLLYKYMASTAKTVEILQEQRPTGIARLTADQATAATISAQLTIYYAQHGQWPTDKGAALAALGSAPRFQCAGNDFDYDASNGQVRLVIQDPARC